MGSIRVILQVCVSIHNAPRMPNANVGYFIGRVLAVSANDFIDDGTRGIGSRYGADGAGTHIGINHFHIYREQAAHDINLVLANGFAAACGVIHRFGYKSNLRQGLAVLFGVFQVFGKAQGNSTSAANDFQFPADVCTIRQCIEFAGDFRALYAEVFGMHKDNRVGSIYKAIFIGFAFYFNGVLYMAGGQKFAAGSALGRNEFQGYFGSSARYTVNGEISFGYSFAIFNRDLRNYCSGPC